MSQNWQLSARLKTSLAADIICVGEKNKSARGPAAADVHCALKSDQSIIPALVRDKI